MDIWLHGPDIYTPWGGGDKGFSRPVGAFHDRLELFTVLGLGLFMDLGVFGSFCCACCMHVGLIGRVGVEKCKMSTLWCLFWCGKSVCL